MDPWSETLQALMFFCAGVAVGLFSRELIDLIQPLKIRTRGRKDKKE